MLRVAWGSGRAVASLASPLRARGSGRGVASPRGRCTGIGATLPEVDQQRDGFGHTVFQGPQEDLRDDRRRLRRGSLSIKADLTTQDLLMQRGPWQRTPYIGQHGRVTVWGDDPIDREEVEGLVRDGYRMVAPKRLRAELGEAVAREGWVLLTGG
jgi:hypothetical protein